MNEQKSWFGMVGVGVGVGKVCGDEGTCDCQAAGPENPANPAASKRANGWRGRPRAEHPRSGGVTPVVDP